MSFHKLLTVYEPQRPKYFIFHWKKENTIYRYLNFIRRDSSKLALKLKNRNNPSICILGFLEVGNKRTLIVGKSTRITIASYSLVSTFYTSLDFFIKIEI